MASDWPLPEGLRRKGNGGLAKDDDKRQKLNVVDDDESQKLNVHECRCRPVADRGCLCGSVNDNPEAQARPGGPCVG